MTRYHYKLYKRAGMWLVRKRRHANSSTVHGPFLGIGNAWDWIKDDCFVRNRAYELAKKEQGLK